MKADTFNVQAIPVLPEIADHVLRMALEDDVSVAKLSGLIEKDQALTARILSLANSSHYRRSRTIYTVRDAVVAMGLEAVKTMALGLCVLDMFPTVKGSGLDYKEFWRHTIACAIYARAIMETLDERLSGKAFSAGLLHDIGKLILDLSDHQLYAGVLERAKDGLRSLIDIEREVIGTTHADIGRSVLEKWGLPGIYVESVWCHHAPVLVIDEDQYRISGVIHIANILTHMTYSGVSGNYFPARITNPLLKRFQLNSDLLDDIMLTVPSEIAAISTELGVGKPGEGLFRLVNKASMRLSDVSIALQQRTIKVERLSRRSDIIISLMANLNRALKISEALETTATILSNAGLIRAFLGGLKIQGMNLVFEMHTGESQRFIRVGDEELKSMIISSDYPVGMSLASGTFVYLKPLDEELGDDHALISTIVEAVASSLKRIYTETTRHEETETLRQALSSASLEKQKAEELFHLNMELIDASPMGLCLVNEKGDLCTENMMSSDIRSSLGITGANVIEALRKDPEMEGLSAAILAHMEYDRILEGSKRVFRIITHPIKVNRWTLILLWDITRDLDQQKRVAAYAKMSAVGNLAATMAHNMKSPLGAIQGFASIMKEDLVKGNIKVLRGVEEDLDFQGMVDNMIIATDNVLKIVNQLLSLTKKWEGSAVLTDLAAFSDGVFLLVTPLTRSSGVVLRKELAIESARIKSQAMEQVIMNCLMNAINASSSGQEVSLRVSSDQGFIVFSIIDHGIGMHEEQIGKIFEPFYSEWPSRTGMGLGLSLAKDIVESIGGNITVVSRPGEGSMFTIRIPEEK